MSDNLEARLESAVANLSKARAALSAAEAMWDGAHELGGGIPGFGGSGSQRAASVVRGAFDRAHKAWKEANQRIGYWEGKVRTIRSRIELRDRREYSFDDVAGASAVMTAGGIWHLVVKVNQKSVTVRTPYSWTDRYTFDRIRDVRFPGEVS